MKKQSLLVVFFEGTSSAVDQLATQIGIFAHTVQAPRISSHTEVLSIMSCGGKTIKMAFDGCGVTNGLTGILFAAGLDGQVHKVIEVVEKMSHYGGVRVVAIGLSRGGIACLKLAKKLASKFRTEANEIEAVSLSMLLFDPVPGNAVWTGFPFTAAFSQNLSACHNLKRVLALYPYEPLPDIAMHAPTLLDYPATTKVEEDVTLGCHQGALIRTNVCPQNKYETASNLSFCRIYDFLDSEGVKMKLPPTIHLPSSKECLSICQTAFQTTHASTRIAHDQTGRNRTVIRRSELSEKCRWLNKHHQQLEEEFGQEHCAPHQVERGSYQLDFEDGWKFCT